MRYLIIGARGQLGREFIKTFERAGENFLALSREELDIREREKLRNVIDNFKPEVVINCSAYNQVDRAEEEFEEALSVNALAVANLAFECRQRRILLIHYSTDYVFDGLKRSLYTEEDRANPINRYGLSKYLGERNIQALLDEYLLFRTSWVYGEGANNFLCKLSQWAKEQEYLKVSIDEFSVPTSTRTIVEITLKAVKRELRGLFHLVNSGYASRYEWAKEYLREMGLEKFIYPVMQEEFRLPARRPYFSAMSNHRISKALGIEIPDWKEELKRFLGGLK